MTTATTAAERSVKSKGISSGGSDDGFRKNGKGGDGDKSPKQAFDKYRVGMWFGIAAIVMMFMAITSAYVIRTGEDWKPISVPSALWLSTLAIIASSITFDGACKALKNGLDRIFKQKLLATTGLGALFLFGQIYSWRQLVGQGIYLSANPHSDFFYLLTGLHALHLLGGIFALAWLVFGAFRNRFTPERRTGVEVTALYWHFMDVLWIYLFLLLFLWRK